LNLSDHEKEHGLTYVLVSCATILSNIGLKDGITDMCLGDIIWKQGKMPEKQGKMPGHIKHERDLNQLYHETKEWMATYYE
jgi:hypothetical protein